jgi:hypothetical protein
MLPYLVLLLSDGKHYKENPLLTRLGLPHPGDEEFVTIRRHSPINVGKPTHFESSRPEHGTETPTRHGRDTVCRLPRLALKPCRAVATMGGLGDEFD